MASGADDLIRTSNCIAQLSNCFLLFITQDECSSYNDITEFQTTVNLFSVSSTTILNKNSENI